MLAAATLLAGVLYGAAARAEVVPGQRTVGFGPMLSLSSGAGATASLHFAPIGVNVSGGYMPLFIFGTESQKLRFNYYSSAELDADLVIGPLNPRRLIEVSLLAGYKYNTHLAHGGSLGVALSINITRKLVGTLTIGLAVHPDAEQALRSKGYPLDREPGMPWLRGGTGFALMFFP
jgi:hypothetical protein